MITRLQLSLDQAEYGALIKISQAELRNPIDQVRYIVRQELGRRGLLPATAVLTLPNQAKQETENHGGAAEPL